MTTSSKSSNTAWVAAMLPTEGEVQNLEGLVLVCFSNGQLRVTYLRFSCFWCAFRVSQFGVGRAKRKSMALQNCLIGVWLAFCLLYRGSEECRLSGSSYSEGSLSRSLTFTARLLFLSARLVWPLLPLSCHRPGLCIRLRFSSFFLSGSVTI